MLSLTETRPTITPNMDAALKNEQKINREVGDVLVIYGRTGKGNASLVPWFGVVTENSCGEIPIRWIGRKDKKIGKWDVIPGEQAVTIQEAQVAGEVRLDDNHMTSETYELARRWVAGVGC